ncbi:MAG TPA: hypothetical protein VHO72_09915 [Bacteroidales bacterium]|nr:hypothetical protein [Bacteroidales bacterium]
MIKKLTLCTLVLLAFVYSCKKDEETENPATENVPLIATRAITYPGSSNVDSTYYVYDSQGRYAGYYDNHKQRVDITYSGSNVIYKAYDDNTLKYTDTYTLNAQGMATQLVRTGAVSGTEKYIYNNANQLTHSVSMFYGSHDTTFYSYEGDNFTQSITRYEENSVVTRDTIRFEYYTDKVSTVNPANYGATFMGPSSKNLIRKKTMRQIIRDYTYEFDSQNRVIKETSANGDNVVNTVHYTYKD